MFNKEHFAEFKSYVKNPDHANKDWGDANDSRNAKSWWDKVYKRLDSKVKNIPSLKNLQDFLSEEANREYLQEICENKNYSAFVCLASIMAWGGQRIDHGAMLFNNYKATIDIIDEMRNREASHSQAYKLFKDARQAKKIKGMGIAFYTKIIFFCEQKHKGYIMDQWLAKSVNLLLRKNDNDKDIIRMTKGSKARDYRDSCVTDNNDESIYECFCNAIDELADRLRESGENIEMALFSKGGKEPMPWRKYVQCQYKKYIDVS